MDPLLWLMIFGTWMTMFGLGGFIGMCIERRYWQKRRRMRASWPD